MRYAIAALVAALLSTIPVQAGDRERARAAVAVSLAIQKCHAAPVKQSCPCSELCVCGCNEGQRCGCTGMPTAAPSVPHTPRYYQPAYQPSGWYSVPLRGNYGSCGPGG